ncbi:hypothetical protein Tco_1293954 [Tanacetum coccineum]
MRRKRVHKRQEFLAKRFQVLCAISAKKTSSLAFDWLRHLKGMTHGLKKTYKNREICTKSVDLDNQSKNFENQFKSLSELERGFLVTFPYTLILLRIKFDTIDDPYNNLKIYEPEVKGTSSSNPNIQNVAFVSSNSTNSTNGAVNTAHGAKNASTQATAINSTTIDNLIDAVICAFFASQQNSPQLDNEDLQQINPDDLKEMELRWQMALLTIRARRFLKNTRRKLIVNGNETIGFDKSKVECYNYHKRGYFGREFMAPRNQENKNRENTRSVPVETTTSSALISCDGLGNYDWSDQVEEGPTNFALMAYSSTSSNSEVAFRHFRDVFSVVFGLSLTQDVILRFVLLALKSRQMILAVLT